ncbi:MAG: sulfate permease, SulP family [Desulfovibrionales bacterium]|nr:sulfate permease, SulP family [Desulfovibrionales bacterium]
MMPITLNRRELAGSLGDLGVLLPMAAGMIMVNGMYARGLFAGVGLFYIAAGLYFRTTIPVQPMKVIGSLAIAMALPREQILAAGLCVGIILLAIGLTGAMNRLAKLIPKPVVRGVQLSTALLLMAQGVRFVLGTSSFQRECRAAEPFMAVHSLGPLPLHWVLGVLALLATLYFLNNKKLPAALVVVCSGVLVGLLFGGPETDLILAPSLPSLLPAGFPSASAFTTALFVLALPQLPMTLGNAVVANADLAQEYFGEDAVKTTNKNLCISMGLANIGGFLLGGMPMCHGAGGLAAHYRFGARSAGSNLIIGAVFVVLAVLLGPNVAAVARLIPMSVLGVLLFFGGAQLALAVQDMRERSDLFVCLTIVGVTLASNLALGYVLGAAAYYALRSGKISI